MLILWQSRTVFPALLVAPQLLGVKRCPLQAGNEFFRRIRLSCKVNRLHVHPMLLYSPEELVDLRLSLEFLS